MSSSRSSNSNGNMSGNSIGLTCPRNSSSRANCAKFDGQENSYAQSRISFESANTRGKRSTQPSRSAVT